MQSAKPPGTQAGNTTGSEAEGPWGKPYERLKALGGPAGGRQGGRPNPRLIAQNGNGGGVGSGDATALTNAKTVLKRQINPSTEQDLFRKVSNSTDWTFLCEVAAAKGVVLPQCAPPSAPATPPVPSFGTPPDESESGSGISGSIPSADEIREINRRHGGTTELTGSADTVEANMGYRETKTEKAAVAIRDIAGGHLFDNGNKRTAQDVAEKILGDDASSERIREVIDQTATGKLRSVEDIASALRGAD